MAPPPPTLTISGPALLKLIQHSHTSLPSMVTGCLLGLSDDGGNVECTGSFAVPDQPAGAAEDEEDSEDEAVEAIDPAFAVSDTAGAGGLAAQISTSGPAYQQQYTSDMIKLLKTVNSDANVVGWYTSSFLGTFATKELLERQLSYQKEVGETSVVVVYDPVQTANSARGEVVLKAYRVSKEYEKAKEEKGGYVESKNVFVEVPVKIKNQGLVRALLFDMDRSNKVTPGPATGLAKGDYGNGGTVDFTRLDLSTNPFLEKNLENLSSWVDDLSAEQAKYQLYARGLLREEGGGSVHSVLSQGGKKSPRHPVDKAARWKNPEAPSRLTSLLSTVQLNTYCDQVNEFADRSFNKLVVAGGLCKGTEGE